MRKVIAAVMALASLNAVAQQFSDPPTEADTLDPQRELNMLGTMNGVWEGFFEVLYDPNGTARGSPGGVNYRITISGQSVDIQAYDDASGKYVPVAAEKHIYAAEGTAMINAVNRNNGFVQNISIFLAFVSPNRMEGYVTGNVHNYLYAESSLWRIFTTFGRISMKRHAHPATNSHRRKQPRYLPLPPSGTARPTRCVPVTLRIGRSPVPASFAGR